MLTSTDFALATKTAARVVYRASYPYKPRTPDVKLFARLDDLGVDAQISYACRFHFSTKKKLSADSKPAI